MLLFYIIIFVFGLIIGSFLNVVIFRLENGEKIVNDRSKCLHCKHFLGWYDLIPVLSFILLKRKCRYCGRSISIQYPLVELGTGILFMMIMMIMNYESGIMNQELLSTFYFLLIASALIVIFVYDLKHYIIPDKVIYPAIVITFIYRMFEILKFNHSDLIGILNQILYLLFPAVLAGGFFYAIVVITKGKGMGGGDIKLGFLMGLILGWPLVLVALFLSFIIGSVVGIFLVFAGNKKMKSMIPFGPFLVLGTFISLFWGERIMKWYLNLLH
ncbi:MAG: prepilin peptidase [Patescibacteria group bacterium]|nr:prepilin peptidase [Patescibacteria group bacterium]